MPQSNQITHLLNRRGIRSRVAYFFKYFPAILSANDGKMMNTVININRSKNSLNGESFLSGPEAVKTTKIPMIPKAIDA